MNPQDLPKGAGAAEVSGSGKPANLPGVYKHAGSGNQVIVMPDAKSTGQQDALVRAGFERVGEPPKAQELVAMQQKQATKDAKNTQPVSSADMMNPNADAPKFNTTTTNSGEGSDNMSTDVTGTQPAQSDPTTPTPPAEPETPAEPSTSKPSGSEEADSDSQTNEKKGE